MNNAIDETSIVTTKFPITKENLPKGKFWDEQGACYEAELCDFLPCGWRWAAINLAALAKGDPVEGQVLSPVYLPRGFAKQFEPQIGHTKETN